MLLFWGAIIYGIFWLIRSTAQGNSPPTGPSVSRASALDILECRFAEGTITEEDYRARRRVLLGDTTGSNAARKDEPLAVR
jgi:uncharacterized membrane protein